MLHLPSLNCITRPDKQVVDVSANISEDWFHFSIFQTVKLTQFAIDLPPIPAFTVCFCVSNGNKLRQLEILIGTLFL